MWSALSCWLHNEVETIRRFARFGNKVITSDGCQAAVTA